MARFAPPALERPDWLDALRRHPWLIASLAAHVVLAASLYAAGPVRVEVQRRRDVRVQVEQSLQETTRREMRRELRTMEAIRDALAQSAGGAAVPKPAAKEQGAPDKAAEEDPLATARRLAAEIEKVQQTIRAAEMARTQRIPEPEALRRVRAADARRPKPPAAPPPGAHPPEAELARLAGQARAALAQRRSQLSTQLSRQLSSPGGSQAGGGNTGMASSAAGSTLDALATGLAQGTPGAITGSSLDMSGSAFSDTRRFGAYLAPPLLDAAQVRAGSGRTLGAGGAYASRVHLDTWYIIGPFEGEGGASQKAVYPPERGIDLDAIYYGKNRLPVRWTFQQDTRYPSVPLPRAENAVYYAYTEVRVDEDVDLWAWIGADDDSKMWLNDRLVWISADSADKPWYGRPFYFLPGALATRNLTEGQRKLHFKKGRNTILFKLYNGVNLMFFSVVLSGAR